MNSGHLGHKDQKIDKLLQQLTYRGIKDHEVLSAMKKVDRSSFVPSHEKYMAYHDSALPIGHEQTISQPFIVASMTQTAQLSPHDRVLEIGTGSGYQTAILAELVSEVYTIEKIPQLAQMAQQRLTSLGYKNIFFKQADGFDGWPEQAPFDAILVTAAPLKTPPALTTQLRAGGRMIIPLGDFHQFLYLICKDQNDLSVRQEKLYPVRFVPLV